MIYILVASFTVGLCAATCDPETMSGDKPAVTQNLVAGEWETNPAELIAMPDPLNGEVSICTSCHHNFAKPPRAYKF